MVVHCGPLDLQTCRGAMRDGGEERHRLRNGEVPETPAGRHSGARRSATTTWRTPARTNPSPKSKNTKPHAPRPTPNTTNYVHNTPSTPSTPMPHVPQHPNTPYPQYQCPQHPHALRHVPADADADVAAADRVRK